MHADRLAGILQLYHLRAEMNLFEQLLEPLLQRLDEVAVGPGQQRVGEFDDRDTRAEFGIDGAHLQADVAATDDEQRFRNVGQFERAGRIHDPRTADVEGRDPRRAGAAGQDAVVEREGLAGTAGRRSGDFKGVGARKPSISPHDGHVATAGQLAKAAGERGDDLVFPGPQRVDVYRGPGEVDPPLLHLAGLGQHAAHVQERFGRDAAPQQAGAAQPFVALHQGHRHAEISCHEGGGIAARTATQHHQWNMHRSGFSSKQAVE